MNQLNVKDSDYAQIGSLAELDAAIKRLQTKISIQEDVIREDADLLFNPFNGVKMLYSSAFSAFLNGGLSGVIARGMDAGRRIIELVHRLKTSYMKTDCPEDDVPV